MSAVQARRVAAGRELDAQRTVWADSRRTAADRDAAYAAMRQLYAELYHLGDEQARQDRAAVICVWVATFFGCLLGLAAIAGAGWSP